jgi:hypothetical protein
MMKRVMNVVETNVDGLEKLLGEYVELYCLNYIYCGRLIGVNEADVCLAECQIVYETGKLSDHTGYKSAEPFDQEERFVQKAHIESYGLAPKLVVA